MKIMYSEEELKIAMIEPGVYKKIIGDEESSVSAEEIVKILIKDKVGEIDPGILEVSLALNAISVFFASAVDQTFLRMIAFLIYLATAYASASLYWTYLCLKFPHLYLLVFESKIGFFALIPHNLKLLSFPRSKKVLKGQVISRETELAHLSLLGCYLGLELLAMFYLLELLGISII